jgi:putative MATE family efflux protein
MDKGKSNELGEHDVGKLIWRFFWPSFIGVTVNALYNIVDRIFIGRGVGALALSGLSVVFPVMILVAAFGMLIGIGAGVRISINLGKKDIHNAERVLGNGFILMIMVGLLVTVIGFIIKTPMLRSFGASEQTIGYAQDYLNIILLGSLFQVVGFSLNNIIRSEGNPRIAMVSMIICAGINVLLNPLFIFGLGMGVKGSAIATVISQFILMIWVISHFFSRRSILRLKIGNMKLDPAIIWQILTIGMAPFAMQIAGSLVQVTYNTQLIRFGEDVAVGAMGIINSVSVLVVMAIVSINMATQPVIGYNYGAGNYSRVRKAWKIGITAGTVISIVAFILVELFPGYIILLFNHDDPRLYTIGIHGIRIFMLMLPVVGWQIINSNYFQSIGKAGISLFLTLLRQVIFLIPLLTFLPSMYGITGIWMASPISDLISAGVVYLFFNSEWKKLRQLERGTSLQL